MWIALALGAVVVIVMVRSGSGSTLSTGSGVDSSAKSQAFLSLAEYEKEKLADETNLAIAKIQASVESQRIGAAEAASISQANAQLAAAQRAADAQNNSSLLGTIGGIVTAAIAAL